MMDASTVTLLVLLFAATQFKSSISSYRGPPDLPSTSGHSGGHNHSDDAVFIYHDTYERVEEGDVVELCARLSRTVDRDIYVEYMADVLSAESGMSDYDLMAGYLVFEPGTLEKCLTFNATDDLNGGEENLEFLYIKWRSPQDDGVYFYNDYYDNYALSLVAIEDNDDLTLTPNATSVTVYEGAYSQICVTPDEVDRDAPAYFYVLFDDKHYTADIYDDLQYTHVHDYPHFYHYGGIYYIYPDEDKTCFHFHTKDDDYFEGNENFAINLFSFTPTTFERDGSGDSNFTPFDVFSHVNFTDGHRNDDGYHDHPDDDHHDHHDDDKDYDYDPLVVSEHLFFDTVIPESLSTIHVTIVDNDEAPCLQKETAPCVQVIEDIVCLRLQREFENWYDVPKPCQRKIEFGLLGKFLRYNPHPLRET